MKKELLLFLSAVLCLFLQVNAQTVIGNQNVDRFPSDGIGDSTYGLTYLPPSYAGNPTKKYPLLIFLHGAGQPGTGIAGLNNLITDGLCKQIANGFQPSAVNPKDGQTYEFIVVSPQAPSWSYNYNTLKYILPNVLARYHIDTSRIYLTGLSAGGDGVFTCLGSGDSSFIKKIAAASTASSAGADGVNNLTADQVIAQFRFATKKYGVQVWQVVGDQDSFLDQPNTQYHDSLNILSPAIPDKLTIISTIGHSAWNEMYDTAYRPTLNSYGNNANCNNGCPSITAPNNNGSAHRGTGATQDSLNVYEWMLQYTRGTAAVSTAPSASAGSNQTIVLPTSTVTLTGTGTPGSGHTISSYAWVKTSGPSGSTITSPTTASTTVTGLVAGTYVFTLTVTQNDAQTASSAVTITVNASAAPTAGAGSNQTITLPTSTVTLTGSGTAASGRTISSYSWVKTSGPAGNTITSPSSATTTVTGLVAGTYTFALTVTQSDAQTATASVTITVNSSGGAPPQVGHQNIDRFPSDAFGDSLYGLTWLPVSYPSSPSKKYPLIIFLHASSQAGTGTAGLTNLITAGLPQRIANGFQPTAVNPKDGQTYEFIVVSPQDPSWTPTYPSLKLILPNILSRYQVDTNRIYIAGTGAGGDATYSILGSADSVFIKKFAGAATASSLGVDGQNGLTDVQVEAQLRNATKKYGVHVWTVTGDQGSTLSTDVRYHDSLNVTAPTVPDKLTVISGLGDTTGVKQYDSAYRPMLNYYGSSVNCDNNCTAITSPNNNGSPRRGSGVTQDSLNLYEWFLINSRGGTPVAPPTANAGGNQTITLPTSTVTLSGSGTPASGHTILYAWTKTSGPAGNTITNPTSASTTVTGLVAGTYIFTLTVTQDDAQTATGKDTITVNPSAPPTASAGTNQSITLPTSTVTLTGSGTAATGRTISSYAWTKASGPSGSTITSPSSASTTVTGLVAGTYVFTLTVTQSDAQTASSNTTITVNAAPSVTANAGSNQTITLPTSTVTLSGSGSTGTITSYAWTKLSGGAATITSPSSVTTTVTGLVQGTYTFQLSVNGGASLSTVSITVNGVLLGNQHIDRFPIDASGDSLYGLTWLPASYASSPTKKYPLIIFLHASSQAGTGTAGLSNLITAGLPQRIANGFQPTAVNPKDGQTYEFIVVSPQDASWTPTYSGLKNILPNVLSRYQVDTSRIYITGWGAGGDATFSILGSADSVFIKKFAGAATSSSQGVDGQNGLTDVQVEAQLRNATKKYGVHVWTVTGDQGSTLTTDVRYHDSLNVTTPAISDKLTVISGLGDTTDVRQYDSAYRPILNYYGSGANCDNNCTSITSPNNNGSPRRGSGATQDSLNLYEWFLLYQRGTSPPSTAPTANAGSNQSITLPVSTVTLTGTGTPGSGHSISSYAWTLTSGPSGSTISSPAAASTTVTGLVAGTYLFTLTVTQNDAQTATSSVTVTVNTGGGGGGTYASPTIGVSADQSITTSSANISASYTLTGATLNSITWTKFSVPGQAKKKIGILGSSTSAGNGASVYDSAYAGRLQNYYQGAGLIDSVINLAVSGYNPYEAMPTGYTPPTDVTNKLSPSDVVDPAHNITALLTHHPDIVIVNFPTNGYDVLTMAEIMTPLQTIYDTCTAHGIQCYVTTTQPRMDATFATQASQNFLQVVRDSILNRFGSHAIDFYDAVAVPGTTLQIPAYMYGDSIHFNDAGHRQFFNQVVGTNIFKNLISSTAVITTPSSTSSSVTSLPVGVNKFQATVIDSHKQAASAVTTITVGSGGGTSCHGTKHIITPDPVDSTVFIANGTTPDAASFLPGDTLVLNSAYSAIDLVSIHGSAACPIVITNQNVQALVTQRLNMSSCTYVKVTGSGTAAQYGILIQQDPVLRQQSYFAMRIQDQSKGIEVERVFMHNVDMGISCETDESCFDSLNYPNWVLDSMYFHDNKIVGTWNEGMYIGNTSPDNASYDLRPVVCNGDTLYPAPMKSGYTKIYNNIVDSTGRGGIQLANAQFGVSEIYNNTVSHNGLNGDDEQGTAISVGLYTNAYIHDNHISNTYTWGFASLGAGAANIPLRIENNTIDSSGYLRHYDLATTNRLVYDPRSEPVLSDDLTWPQSLEVDTRGRLYTTDSPHPGTAIHGQDSTEFWVKNNIIGKSKANIAVNIEDQASSMQKEGNIICANVNLGTGTAATVAVVAGVNYATNCSGGTGAITDPLTATAAALDTAFTGFVKVYPNPVIENSVTLSMHNSNTGKMIVSVFDVNGRQVRGYVFTKSDAWFQQQLTLAGLPEGMYLLKVQFANADKPYFFKLIK